MSADCIFCKIIAGEIPSATIHESEHTIAFLDIAPVLPGHALVIPRKHYANLFELPDDLGNALLSDVKRVGEAIVSATGAQGLNLGMNNHEAAGQLVMHAHFHLIPRFDGDGLKLWGQQAYESQEAMMALAEKIRNSLS